MAATNCLNFGSPEKPEVMWQFSQAIDGVAEACVALGTPITGGNVSFYNETLGKSIYPTPVIGMLGILDDFRNVLKVAFHNAGDVILLLWIQAGPPAIQVQTWRGYFRPRNIPRAIAGIVAGKPPPMNLAAEKALIDCLVALARRSVQSAHDISDGGLAVTLAESCFAADDLGAT